MKKFLSCLLLFAVSSALFAQVNINNDGTVYIGSSTHTHGSFLTAKKNFESYVNNNHNKDLIAIQGAAYMTNPYSWDKAVGVFGIAGNAGNGHNMGVLGYLGGSSNGAGVFGSTNDNLDYVIPGQYAGFFYGDMRTTGNIQCASLTNTSDLRLKDNVCPVSETEGDYRYLDRVLDMNVLEYNLVDNDASDSDQSGKKVYIDDLRHIGLAAQELKEMFPNLVVEDQMGYMSVNYIELVPVLIRSIQELKQELDEVRTGSGTRGTTDVSKSFIEKNKLYQNSPNPFQNQTVIHFKLSEEARDASICIFDMQGKMLKKLPVTNGEESVIVDSSEFGNGLYLYSLIVNGQEVDTKKMVISK